MNKFLKSILNCTTETKYSRWYASIISSAISRDFTRKQAKAVFGYTESHHILPKSFGLGGDRDPYNIVFLSPKEHFVCHLILARIDFGSSINKKMKYAVFCMMNQRKNGRTYRVSSSLYEKAKLEFSANQSKFHWSQTTEGRKLISDRNKGRIVSEHQRAVASDTHKGIPKSEEHRKKISESTTGKQKTKSDKWREAKDDNRFNWSSTTVCDKCGSKVSAITYHRYHGGRCGAPVEKLYWWYNHETNETIRIGSTKIAPDGFVRGRRPRLIGST